MDCSFNFRPVGQGCFFTGTLEPDGVPIFNLVYDCGSLTAGAFLDHAIKDFRTLLRKVNGKKTIDLLIISHFDEDHINGIVELIKDVKCKNVIMPYMSVFERLAVFGKGGAKAEWHRRFLQNPQAFLSGDDFDIDRIIMVDGSAEINGEVTNPTFSTDPGDPIPSSPAPEFHTEDALVFDTLFTYVKVPFTMEYKMPRWLFKFYIKPFPRQVIKDFQIALSAAVTFTNVSELFEDKYRLIIKGIYKKIFKNINKTSLCVSIMKATRDYVRYDDDPNYLFDYDNREWGILLTGDAFLSSENDRLQFISYYQAEMEDTVLFQIPHHGSFANSFLDIASDLWQFPLYVINHGEGRVKHPDVRVADFVRLNHLNVKRATELNGFELRYFIT